MSSKTHRSILAQNTLLMRFLQPTIKRSKMIKLQCACFKHTRLWYLWYRFHFILLRFRPSTLIRFACVFVLIHSQGRFQIDAFSMKTLCVLVCTKGLNALKCISLWKQPFHLQRRRARRNGCFRRLKCMHSRENKAQELYPLLMPFSNENALVCTGPKSFRSPFLPLFTWMRINLSIKKHIQHSAIMRITFPPPPPTPTPTYLKA